MIDLQEIEDEISRLEHGQTTYSSCEKLSVLYTVRNCLRKGEDPVQLEKKYAYSFASAPETEFMQIARNADYEETLKIIDEHLTSMQIVYPKEYKLVIDKLKKI